MLYFGRLSEKTSLGRRRPSLPQTARTVECQDGSTNPAVPSHVQCQNAHRHQQSSGTGVLWWDQHFPFLQHAKQGPYKGKNLASISAQQECGACSCSGYLHACVANPQLQVCEVHGLAAPLHKGGKTLASRTTVSGVNS